jgi:ElaB/YqjD/DUF883 family membrane-anchored ribosome-binding protein
MAGKGEGGHPRMTANYPTGSSTHSEEQKGLKESAREMASRAGEAAGQLKDKAQEFASSVQGRAQETWRGARDSLQEGFSTVADRAGDFWGDATEIVRRYPLASLAIAFGLGCLTASALSLVSRTDDMTERMSRSSM